MAIRYIGDANSQNKIRGAADGVAIPAGYIGEQQINTQSSPAVSMPASGQYGGDHSITLGAGVWLISAIAQISANGATVTSNDFFIGTASGNNTTGRLLGNNHCEFPVATASVAPTGTIPAYYVNINTSTTYYLKMRANYSVATPNYTYRISAVRIG